MTEEEVKHLAKCALAGTDISFFAEKLRDAIQRDNLDDIATGINGLSSALNTVENCGVDVTDDKKFLHEAITNLLKRNKEGAKESLKLICIKKKGIK